LERVVQPLTDVRDISKLAYGFMATQALVAALDLNLFGLLRHGPATSGALADRTGVRADRLEMLLTALVALAHRSSAPAHAVQPGVTVMTAIPIFALAQLLPVRAADVLVTDGGDLVDALGK
jgi:hypothetical protein